MPAAHSIARFAIVRIKVIGFPRKLTKLYGKKSPERGDFMTNHCYGLLVVFAVTAAGCQGVSQPDGPIAAGPVGPPVQRTQVPQELPAAIDFSGRSFVRGEVVATIIDTREFPRQIVRTRPFRGEPLSTNIFRPAKHGEPGLIIGPANGLESGALTDQNRIAPKQKFPGITSTPWTPPDPTIAVGPNHIVQTVNMELAFFDKDGTLQFQQRLDSTGNPGFFEELGSGDFCFDPKCFYDHNSQRYFVLALEVYSGSSESWITFAVSDDDDPHGVWYKYRSWSVVTYDGLTTYWVDYPGLGYDANGFYVTGNLFKLDGPGAGFGGVLFRAFDKTPLLNGQAASFNDIATTSTASVQVAQHFGSNTAPYFASRASSTQIRVQAMNDPFGSPSLSTAFVSVPSGPSPPAAETPTGTLDIVGSRIMNVHWRDGSLWTTHAVESDDGTRAAAQWYEINTGNWPSGPTPTLVQSGKIDVGAPFHTFFPAIYTNDSGNAALVFGRSSSSENPSVYGTGRLVDDPLGTMGTPEFFVIGSDSATGRWGDYFDVALDPTDGLTFWMVGEYREPGGWRTNINSFTLPEDIAGIALSVIKGSVNAGGVPEIQESDDQYAVLDPIFQAARYQLVFTVDAVAHAETPTAMEFNLESRTLNFVGTIDQEIELMNYNTGQFESVDMRLASSSDTVTQVSVTGDPARFVEPGTQAMQARITYQNSLPYWVVRIANLYLPFRTSVDHVYWTITP